MKDYKELVEILRDETFCDKHDYFDAADAIEQLMRERDAAVKDMEDYYTCDTCIHSYGNENDCIELSCCSYKWRGVQNDT